MKQRLLELGAPRSPITRLIIFMCYDYARRGEYFTASEFSEITGLPSRYMYSFSKWWISKGVIVVERFGRRYGYRLSPDLMDIDESELLRWLGYSSKSELIRAAREAARRLLAEELGGEPSDVEEAVVAVALRAHLSGRRLLEYSDPEQLRRDVSREAGREVDYSELWAAIMRLRNAGVLAAPGPRKARSMRGFWMRLTGRFLGELARLVPALRLVLEQAAA